MSPDAKFTFGLAPFDQKTDENLWDTLKRGDDLMKMKKPNLNR